MHTITWHTKHFSELTGSEVHDILRLRVDVFVVEQRCVYAEVDGQDTEAVHVMGQAGDGGLVAYARILPPHGDGLPHIGRVVVHPEHRGQQLGRALMHRTMAALEMLYGSRRSALAAQEYLVGFYNSFGFRAVGGSYLWDGIAHVDMEHDLA
ncbi:MAG: GNAT family N-acetyltransferase [Bacteroidetes bacterium]|jgi:ElaA protein|nr:GNAT family N-acetyltransferase [Bacteroidota bacterium]MBX7129945.1 GNAT family N-acetyltransferase [Flavobacteriales bacterium]MCC6656258.1 GNAT family N-acetyltransferase [Flavobacteriales bacterium]HMU15589.1 GNAT family N-acetyltransferase [Flavobacteriales bacterium]HMW96163.1 GNAT family N-acetyltransferase [Flavobacteriales bacterium]